MNCTNTGNKETRAGFGAGLLEAGRSNSNVVALKKTKRLIWKRYFI
jgi:transketolase